MTVGTNNAKFLEGDLTKHIVVMSLSSAIGFLAIFVVDFVDLLFISLLGVQELAAAVGYAGSILFVTSSVTIGLGIAAGALVARSLGASDPDRAKAYFTHATLVGTVFSIIFAWVIYARLHELTSLAGASGETQRLAIAYLAILTPTMPLMLIGIVTSAALRSHGAAAPAMSVTLVAGGVNAVLDPILIFWFDLGLAGAAWATVASRFAMAATGIWFMARRFGGFSRLSLAAAMKDIGPIAAISLPAILANVATPVGSAYVTRAMSEFGEGAVAGMAIIGRITPIAFALVFAISGSIGPIIGQNFGAGRHDRVRDAFNSGIILIVAYVVPVVLVLFIVRGSIADLFVAEGVTRDLIFLFCGPLSLAWIFNGIIFVANACYNNLNHPFYSTWVNWGRNTLGVVPFAYVGSQVLGAQGVLVGQMAGGIIVAIASVILARRVIKQSDPASGGDVCPFARHRDEFRIANLRR